MNRLRTATAYLVVLTSLLSCSNDMSDIRAVMSRNTMQEDRASDVTIIYSEQGRVKSRLSAKEFIRNEKTRQPYTDMRNGLKVEFYNDSLKTESTLTAKYARYYEKQGNVLIRDSIIVINKKGEKLETEELIWNQQIEQFYTEKAVAITTPTQTMWGNGLEANQDFTWYRIHKLKGVMMVDKDKVPE